MTTERSINFWSQRQDQLEVDHTESAVDVRIIGRRKDQLIDNREKP